MGHRAGAVIGSREKDNIAGLCLGGRNDGTLVINALRRGTGQVVDASCRVHPADKARTVKGGGGAGAAPHICLLYTSQYPSFDLFVKLITMFDVSVDQFIHADGGARSSSCRKHIDCLLYTSVLAVY